MRLRLPKNTTVTNIFQYFQPIEQIEQIMKDQILSWFLSSRAETIVFGS